MAANGVECDVCPHLCRLSLGQVGLCGVRVGAADRVVPDGRQAVAAVGVQEIEAHPLYHFRPQQRSLCIGAAGCTASCGYCQNWELALAPRLDHGWRIGERMLTVEEVVPTALRRGCQAVSFTYNEMLVWREAMLAISQAARKSELATVWITNGFATSKSLEMLMPWIDAVKIDIKGWDARSSMKMAGIDVSTLREFVAAAVAHEVWLESSIVVTMPEYAESQNRRAFIALVLELFGPDRPFHLQRFFPTFRRSNEPFGAIELLQQFRREAMDAGLRYVYISNVPGLPEADTFCPRCGLRLAHRKPGRRALLPTQCSGCGNAIPGVGLVDVEEHDRREEI
jgi:pyruvate formate lyase activating enzyme